MGEFGFHSDIQIQTMPLNQKQHMKLTVVNYYFSRIALLFITIICFGLGSCKKKTNSAMEAKRLRFSAESSFVIAGNAKKLIGVSVNQNDSSHTFWTGFAEDFQVGNQVLPLWNFFIYKIHRTLQVQKVCNVDTWFYNPDLPAGYCSYFAGNNDAPVDTYDINKTGPESTLQIDSQATNFKEIWGHYNLHFQVHYKNSDHFFPDTFSCRGSFHVIPLDSAEWRSR